MSEGSEQKAQYVSRRLTPADMPHLLALSLSAFGRMPEDASTLEKKFDTTALGPSCVGYLAFAENGEPGAFYGVFPLNVKIGGKIVSAAQSGNTMTHKNHQGKGLFVRLAKETYALAAEEGIRFVFGFPNANSYPGFVRKLDWQHPENMQRFSKKVTTLPVAAVASKSKWMTSCYRSLLKGRLQTREFFESSILASGQDGVLRDAAFWNYKSYGTNFTFTAGGVKVWARIDGFLYIGDIEYLPSVDYSRVLKKIARKAAWWGCHKIVFQCSADTWLSSILARDYTAGEGLPVGFVTFNGSPDVSGMRYTMADFDTF